MDEYYQLDTKEVLKKLETRLEGLSHEEAEKRLKQYGNRQLVNNYLNTRPQET